MTLEIAHRHFKCHGYIAKEYIEKGNFVPLFNNLTAHYKQIYLFYSTEAQLDPKIQSFIQFIKKTSFEKAEY